MDEFLKKLSETGIKTLDLLNKGIDKLPDGFEAMLSALEFKYKVTGFIWLVFGFVCLTLLVVAWIYILKTRWLYEVEEYSPRPREEFSYGKFVLTAWFSLITGAGAMLTLCNFHVWYMALDPRGYILMRVAEHLLGIDGK